MAGTASPRDRLTVTVTRRLPPAVESRMAELFDVTLRDVDVRMSREELAAAMRDTDVLVPTVTDQIDANLLAQAGDRLRLIANYGAGVDHIDVETARQRGVLVSNTPGAATEDTADMAIALMLAVTRRIPEGLAEMQAGRWEGWAPGGRTRPPVTCSRPRSGRRPRTTRTGSPTSTRACGSPRVRPPSWPGTPR